MEITTKNVSGLSDKIADAVLMYWFGDLKEGEIPSSECRKLWWSKVKDTDISIKDLFEKHLEAARALELRSLERTPRGILALIVLLDQFSRNIYRNTPRAFSQDALALKTALKGMERGLDETLHPMERTFYYMPLMHSEDIGIQKISLESYARLEMSCSGPPELREVLCNSREYAEKHAEIIARFGRYPHRNEILGRRSTEEEIKFLEEPGSSF